MQFSGLPRVRLADLPTPLDELSRLSKVLKGPRLFIKRDDNTGLAFGGNKVRKLEYLLGEALEQGADTIITAGALQSNHARQTTAAANKLGLKTILVLRGAPPSSNWKANLLLDSLLGADVRFVPDDPHIKIDDVLYDISLEVEGKGGIPYVIPVGGSVPTGSIGYVAAVMEILEQIYQKGIGIDYIVSATSSGGTQTGLILGAVATNSNVRVIGISVSRPKEVLAPRIVRLANETAQKIGIDVKITLSDVRIYDEYIGPGYAVPTRECINAIRLLAREEGILLDPVYTGKAMAGLIDLVRVGAFREDESVLFIHTGGTPALFADEGIFQASG
ncbi:MAG TPA: D-cysteine desulfhydrase family protein [Candidatus Latescibacteria bacterium]|nr:D-cysteine desulfhydrase family protein [Candidatus Latescibacterota bacterium]